MKWRVLGAVIAAATLTRTALGQPMQPGPGATASPAPASPSPAPYVPPSGPPGALAMGIATGLAVLLIAFALWQTRGRLDQRRAALVGGVLCFAVGFDGCVASTAPGYRAIESPFYVGTTIAFAVAVSLPGFIIGWLMGGKEK